MREKNERIERASSFLVTLRILGRGLRRRCPRCATGHLFAGYLKPRPACASCDAQFSHIRADDAPPYFTLMLVGHIVIPAALLMFQAYEPPVWLMWVIWMPVMLALILLFLPPVKGATLALMWGLGISGRPAGG